MGPSVSVNSDVKEHIQKTLNDVVKEILTSIESNMSNESNTVAKAEIVVDAGGVLQCDDLNVNATAGAEVALFQQMSTDMAHDIATKLMDKMATDDKGQQTASAKVGGLLSVALNSSVILTDKVTMNKIRTSIENSIVSSVTNIHNAHGTAGLHLGEGAQVTAKNCTFNAKAETQIMIQNVTNSIVDNVLKDKIVTDKSATTVTSQTASSGIDPTILIALIVGGLLLVVVAVFAIPKLLGGTSKQGTPPVGHKYYPTAPYPTAPPQAGGGAKGGAVGGGFG